MQGLTRTTPAGPKKATVYRPLHQALRDKGPTGIAPLYEELKRQGTYALDELVMAEIGYTLFNNARAADAIPFFELSIQDYPQGVYAAISHRYLGLAQQQLGDKAKAMVHFKKALEINPNDVRAKRGLQELEGLPEQPTS